MDLMLITQLIKLGAAAAIASALVRSRDFKRLLFLENPTLRQKISLVIFISGHRPAAMGAYRSWPPLLWPALLSGCAPLGAANCHLRDYRGDGGDTSEDLECGPHSTET